ncbi:MAG: hypothetical protein RL090_564 [Bacteroidota bacterium]
MLYYFRSNLFYSSLKMKRFFFFLLVAVPVTCLFAFFKLRNTDTEKFEHLIESREFVGARGLLQEIDGSDTLFYLSAIFRLEMLDSSGDFNQVISSLAKMPTDGADSVFISSLYDEHASQFKSRLASTDPASMTEELQKLSESDVPSHIKASIASQLRERAKKEQTVASWNNCILFFGDEDGSAAEMVSERRKIYLDTLALERNGIHIDSVVAKNPCYIPVLTRMDRVHNRAFTFDELHNPDFPKGSFLASRFIVGDFNSVDSKGNCRGSFDIFAEDHSLPEFKQLLEKSKSSQIDAYDYGRLESWFATLPTEQKTELADAMWMWRNYLDKVHKYKTEPLNRDPVIEINGKNYCIGQRMCLCEIKNDTILMVAQFVTSSRNVNYPHSALRDYDEQPRYYAPRCLITSRYWDSAVPYDSLDIKRDKIMGFASRHVIKYKGSVNLPNFLHMTPTDEFRGAKGYVNGIHEFAVGGNGPAKYMGTPISLGCVRLHDYPSKFVRWWIPKNARFFISYEYKRYIQRI